MSYSHSGSATSRAVEENRRAWPSEASAQIVDTRSLPDRSVVQADICIIGGGPAGLTLASELAGHGTEVCLLESGGLAYDPKIQELCRGELAGDGNVDPYIVRNRQFGGLSNNWTIDIGAGITGVRYAPMDSIDLEVRPGVPHSGWPISRTHLDPYYERAHDFCELGPFRYDGQHWASERAPIIELASGVLETTMFQLGPADVYHTKSRDRIGRSRNVRAYLHANVVGLDTEPVSNTVARARVATLTGKQVEVMAKVFVLAAGAIENARLMLLSNGLGNAHDTVGRYLMDHPLNYENFIVAANPQVYQKIALFDLVRLDGVSRMGKFTFSERTIREHELLNMSTQLFPREWTQSTPGVTSFRRLLNRPNRFEPPAGLLRQLFSVATSPRTIALHLRRISRHPGAFAYLGLGGWSGVADKAGMFSLIDVVHQVEQYPHFDNRVTLSGQRDPLGQLMVKLDYRWTRGDQQRFARSNAFIAKAIEEAGIGKYHFDPEVPPSEPSAHHQMGTTRMHTNPKLGVVDANCRVHGVANLFATGASVFPSGGFANPTLTIVALAMRLADLLKVELAPSHR